MVHYRPQKSFKLSPMLSDTKKFNDARLTHSRQQSSLVPIDLVRWQIQYSDSSVPRGNLHIQQEM